MPSPASHLLNFVAVSFRMTAEPLIHLRAHSQSRFIPLWFLLLPTVTRYSIQQFSVKWTSVTIESKGQRDRNRRNHHCRLCHYDHFLRQTRYSLFATLIFIILSEEVNFLVCFLLYSLATVVPLHHYSFRFSALAFILHISHYFIFIRIFIFTRIYFMYVM